MTHHPLDGNAIAADEHYSQTAPTECSTCGAPFDIPDVNGVLHIPHRGFSDLCSMCGDEAEEQIGL